MRAIAAPVTGVLAAGTACGGGGGSDENAAERSVTGEAQQQAESIVLQLSDLPRSWRASTPSAEDVARATRFRRCIGGESSELTLTGEATSKRFIKWGDVTGAYSEAQIAVDSAQAEDGFRRYADGMASAKSKRCFQHAIGKREILPEIPTDDLHKLGEADVRELRLTPPPVVEEGRAWAIEIPVKVTAGPTKGATVPVYFDVVFLRNGNRLAYIQTSDVLSPADSKLRDKLVQAVARRMS